MKMSFSEKIQMISKYKSFSEAAEHMFLTPQAILRFVNQTEEELGFRLFERSYAGIRLTKAGQCFVDGLERLSEQREQLVKRCLALSRESNTIRLPLINDYSPLFFEGSVIPEYKKRYPNVTIEFVPCRAEDLLDSLMSEKIDCVHYSKTAGNSDKLEFTPIFPLTQYCIMMRSHPLATKESISFADLQSEKVYVLSLCMYKHQLELFKRNGVQVKETNLSYKRICLEHGIYLTTFLVTDIPVSLAIVPMDDVFADTIGIFSRKNPDPHVADYICLAQEILSK